MRLGLGLGLPAGGGAVFTPASLAGLSFWVDPSQSATVTLNGGDVQNITDLTGNGRHANQATAANQPAYSTADVHGLNDVTFTAANNDFLNILLGTGISQNVSGFATACVLKAASLAAVNRVFTIFGGGGAARFLWSIGTTGKLTMTTRRLDADANVVTTAASVAVTAGTAAFVFVQVDYANGAYVLQVGSTRETGSVTWAGGNGSTSNTASSTAPAIGRSGANVYGGVVGEFIGAGRAFTTSEIDKLRAYCLSKWGV